MTIETIISAATGDNKLAKGFNESFESIVQEYLSNDPVGLLQNTGLFVEAAIRVLEHIIFGKHTPLNKKLKLDDVVTNLEKANGPEGIRIHCPRLARSIYDFRSRKYAVHFTSIDPKEIDGHLVYCVANWVVIEIITQLKATNAEKIVAALHSRKIPLVQEVDGILRTTSPILTGPNRVLLLLYASPSGLTVIDLLKSTQPKIRDKNHLMKTLRDLSHRDLVCSDDKFTWKIFGAGLLEVEKLYAKLY